MTPKISVVMGIYNCAPTLKEAVNSIINQTYRDWELILCDDGSKDYTLELAKELAQLDSRIVVIQNDRNRGLNYTLNHCLKYARGEFIARMDGDDLCDPSRFEKQINILENNTDIAIVSSPMIYFDEYGEWARGKAVEYPDKFTYLTGSPFCHAPCMVRKEAYDAVEGYSDEKKYHRCEDYHLWYKMMKLGYKGYNIQECLYSMRDDKAAAKRRKLSHRLRGMMVQLEIFNGLEIPFYYYPLILKGPISALVPTFVYEFFHKFRLK